MRFLARRVAHIENKRISDDSGRQRWSLRLSVFAKMRNNHSVMLSQLNPKRNIHLSNPPLLNPPQCHGRELVFSISRR
jgi:hypothetical protein